MNAEAIYRIVQGKVTEKVGETVSGYLGSEIFKFLGLGEGPDPAIVEALKTIEENQKRIMERLHDVLQAIDWQTRILEAHSSQTSIRDKYQRLLRWSQGAKKPSPQDVKRFTAAILDVNDGVERDLFDLHHIIMGDSDLEKTDGLLALFLQKYQTTIQRDPHAMSLYQMYHDSRDYLSALFGLQLQGLNLLTSAHISEGALDEAQAAVDMVRQNLKAQFQEWQKHIPPAILQTEGQRSFVARLSAQQCGPEWTLDVSRSLQGDYGNTFAHTLTFKRNILNSLRVWRITLAEDGIHYRITGSSLVNMLFPKLDEYRLAYVKWGSFMNRQHSFVVVPIADFNDHAATLVSDEWAIQPASDFTHFNLRVKAETELRPALFADNPCDDDPVSDNDVRFFKPNEDRYPEIQWAIEVIPASITPPSRVAYIDRDARLFLVEKLGGMDLPPLMEGVKKVQLLGKRTLVLRQDNSLVATESHFLDDFELIVGGAVDFTMVGDRLAILQGGGRLVAKDGGLGGGWVNQADGVRRFKLTASRIAYLDGNNRLYAKEGSLATDFALMAGGVVDFALAPNRLAILQGGGPLVAKEGGLDGTWVTLHESVHKVQLLGDKVLALDTQHNLYAKEGALNAEFRLIAGGVIDFAMEGDRLVVMQGGGHLVGKDGGLGGAWVTLREGAAGFLLQGRRIVTWSADGVISAKEGGLDATWVEVGKNAVSVEVNSSPLQTAALG